MFKKDENQMNDAQSKTCKHNIFTQKLALIIMLMTASTMSAAELKWKDSDQDSESEVAYVDSVTKWGAWELDIEPAAGGLTPPSTQAMNPRNSKVRLRTNSISALAPPGLPSPTPTAIPKIPATPSTPVVPSSPTIRPISPSVPIPVGGPGIPGRGPGA